jgi:hypothetical protein
MKQRFVAVAVVLSILGAVLHAAGPEEDYVQIYNQIQEADRQAQNQRPDQARSTYLAAQTRLLELSKQYPDWNPNIIRFRLNYVSRKLTALESGQPAASTAQPQAQPDTTAPLTGDPGQQVEQLRARASEPTWVLARNYLTRSREGHAKARRTTVIATKTRKHKTANCLFRAFVFLWFKLLHFFAAFA